MQWNDKVSWWSLAVFLDQFSPIVGPGHEHSLLDAVAFSSYPRHDRLERDLAIWLTKEVFDKLSQNVVDVPLGCKCALETTKGVWLSKEMAPQIITPR
ncbi:hypothetical protein TNCV_331851 [Trichonephila clavipes]|nr:hypothetical protein TNCV_331851 [Trichonephila clavipes]